MAEGRGLGAWVSSENWKLQTVPEVRVTAWGMGRAVNSIKMTGGGEGGSGQVGPEAAGSTLGKTRFSNHSAVHLNPTQTNTECKL